MVTITEATIIKTHPKNIWDFLANLDKNNNYNRWHPRDHILFELRKGSMGQVGGMAYFEERIGNFTLKLSYRTVKANYPFYLEYEAAPPLSWFKAGKGSFRMERINKEAVKFVAYVEYGYRLPTFGWALDWIIGRIIKSDDARKHMREEGENLKQILETGFNN